MSDFYVTVDKKLSTKTVEYDFDNDRYITTEAYIKGYIYTYNEQNKRQKHGIYDCYALSLDRDKVLLTILRRDGKQEHYKSKLISNKEFCFKVNKKSISTCYVSRLEKLIDLFTDDFWSCYRDAWINQIINTPYFKA